MIGSLIQVADPKDDGEGGEFLRIRARIDITKAFPQCCKLWSDGEHVGWALLKSERLPNFCYWCRKVTHGERDCEVWLQGKGRLKKEDQHYGEWLRADPIRHMQKSVMVVPSSSCGAPKWKKGPAMPKKQSSSKEVPESRDGGTKGGEISTKDTSVTDVTTMEFEPASVLLSNASNIRNAFINDSHVNTVELNNGLADLGGQFHATMPMQNVVGSDNSALNNVGLNGPFSFSAKTLPLSDITNQAITQPRNGPKKKWSKFE